MSNATTDDFFEANQVETWDDIIDAGTISNTSTVEAIADDMLANWTFDDQIVPDRDELIEALKALQAADDA